MINRVARKAGVAAATVVLGAACAAMFGGTAFAGGHGDHTGQGGDGGGSRAACLVPVGVSAGIVGQGQNVDNCNSRGGDGGAGGDVDHN